MITSTLQKLPYLVHAICTYTNLASAISQLSRFSQYAKFTAFRDSIGIGKKPQSIVARDRSWFRVLHPSEKVKCLWSRALGFRFSAGLPESCVRDASACTMLPRLTLQLPKAVGASGVWPSEFTWSPGGLFPGSRGLCSWLLTNDPASSPTRDRRAFPSHPLSHSEGPYTWALSSQALSFQLLLLFSQKRGTFGFLPLVLILFDSILVQY